MNVRLSTLYLPFMLGVTNHFGLRVLFTVNNTCWGQILVIQSPILHSAVQLGGSEADPEGGEGGSSPGQILNP